jgi:acylphosphatase
MLENEPVSEAVRRRIVVEGRVQGVFFRDTCRDEATAADINGVEVTEAEPEGLRGFDVR